MGNLKPCPFCGGQVKINYNIESEPDGIWCKKCRMMVRYPNIRVKGNEPFGICIGKLEEAWNRRSEA